MANQNSQTAVIEVDEFGFPREYSSASWPYHFLTAAFPSGPIKAGSTWRTVVKVGSHKVFVNAKLAKVDKYQGRDALMIVYTDYHEPDTGLAGPTTVWVDPTNGRVLRSIVDLKTVSKQNGVNANRTIKVKLELAK